jgi:hypothetical protein
MSVSICLQARGNIQPKVDRRISKSVVYIRRVNASAQGREVHKRMRWTLEDEAAPAREVHKRMRWTLADEAALRAAVAACDKGNWTRIRLHNPALEKYNTGQIKVGMCLEKMLVLGIRYIPWLEVNLRLYDLLWQNAVCPVK